MTIAGKTVVVAVGVIFEGQLNEWVHGSMVSPENVKVQVDVIAEGREGVVIPVPSYEIETLGEALHSFVQWPRNLAFSDDRVRTQNFLHLIYFCKIKYFLNV